MLIRCPQCSTGFNLAAEKIPAKGAKVKCSACTHTFRVRVESGEPVFFYKRGEAPRTGETMIGAPLDVESMKATVAVDDDDNDGGHTQFGIPQRSKSSTGDYNPFPLAGNITGEQPAVSEEDARNDRTQILGSDRSEPEELDEADLLDEDADFANPDEQTQLGPSGMAPTRVGGGPPPPLSTIEDDRRKGDKNDATQAFGSGKLDLFDGEPPPTPAEPPQIDIDPFGDAFDEPVGDVGLLMPSTPITDDPKVQHSVASERASDVGMSEEDFLLGGGMSEFGDAASLVDHSFGMDVPSFDPNSGVVDGGFGSPKRPSTGQRRSLKADDGSIELEDIRSVERPRRQAPEKPAPTRSKETARPAKKRAAPGYVDQIGATSAVRRTFDVLFISIVVCIGAIALTAAQTGGFIDFARFGHTVEVAWGGAEFEPREEWVRTVEIPPPDPPPDEPLRLHNVRAIEKKVSDRTVLVLAGSIRNYSLEEFTGVKVKILVTNDGKEIVNRADLVGQLLDRKKFGKAKTLKAVEASLQKKLADIGKEGKTYFAFVLDEVPTEVVEAGKYDYSVEVAD